MMATDSTELVKKRTTCMDTSYFDPTEKIVCTTTVQSLYARIQKIDSTKRLQILDLLERSF